MPTLCSFTDLTKAYSSEFKLGPVNLKIQPGELVGVLGRNGAGKTTLLRLMIGVLRPDSGSLRLWGMCHENDTKAIKERIGYVDEEPIIYDWMDSSDLEQFLAPYYPRWSSSDYSKYLQDLEIPPDRSFRELSRGNTVKLSTASALAKKPDLLILDEPTSGLDPVVRQEILHLLRSYREDHPEASVVFSSHILSDLEQVCTRVVAMDNGRVLADAPLAEFHRPLPGKVGRPANLEGLFLELIGKG